MRAVWIGFVWVGAVPVLCVCAPGASCRTVSKIYGRGPCDEDPTGANRWQNSMKETDAQRNCGPGPQAVTGAQYFMVPTSQ
jgi:hypothetical protein